MAQKRPVVGIPADRRMLDPHPFHAVGEKYIAAVERAAGALPVLIPAFGDAIEPEEWLDRVDGILFTGSTSNVEPQHYQGSPSDPGTLHDPHRDATTLPLIPRALELGVPVLGICRGFQEINVAFGGTLHQKLHEVPGRIDHRENYADPLDVQYAPVHDVVLVRGGFLHGLAGRDRVRVNSLHAQGIDRLAAGLLVEAHAADGQIEAFRVDGAPGFALAVQWHPEWKVMDNEFSRAIFAAFGAAARTRMDR